MLAPVPKFCNYLKNYYFAKFAHLSETVPNSGICRPPAGTTMSVKMVCVYVFSKNDICYAGILYFVSSTVNPILYNVMSLRYRKAFRDTLHAALIMVHCQQPDTPSTLPMAVRRNCSLLRGNLSDSNLSQLQMTNRRARSAERVGGWTPPHSRMRPTVSTHHTVTATVCHKLSDEGSRTLQHPEC